jgi:hypothetical protein
MDHRRRDGRGRHDRAFSSLGENLILGALLALALLLLPSIASARFFPAGGAASAVTPVITFNAPSASYIYPSASGTALTTVTATVSPGSFLPGGGNFTSSNCASVNIAVASGGAVTVAGPSNLTGSQTCLITARYPGAVNVTQTFTLTGTQQTIASINSSGGCTLGGGCSYSFTTPATGATLDVVPAVTMSGGIAFSGTIVLGTGLQCTDFAISGGVLQITAASAGTYACSYTITDANASNSPQTPAISAVGGAGTNVIGVALTNENVVPGASIGTQIGNWSATVTGGGPCTTCTWSLVTSGVPTGQPGPACTTNSNNVQLVPFGSGQVHMQAAVNTLTAQTYGPPPASQGFLCITAMPAVGSSYTFAFSLMVRGNVFTSVSPRTVNYTPGTTSGTTIATMSATVHGTTGTQTVSLGADTMCGNLSVSGNNLVAATTLTAQVGVCHVTVAQTGVTCPILGYITATPTTCVVPVLIEPSVYVGPGDVFPGDTAWSGPYAYSAAYAATGGAAWTVIRESDQQTFVMDVLSNGDADIAGLATFCDTSICYMGSPTTSAETDQSGHTPANDLFAYADRPGGGSPLTVWRPVVLFNCVNGVYPCKSNSNGTDRFTVNRTTFNGSGATGMIEASAEAFAIGSIFQQVMVFNDTNGVSPDTTKLQFSSTAGQVNLYVGPDNNSGTPIVGTVTANAFHGFLGVVNGASSILDADGTQTTGTLPGAPTANMQLPYEIGGSYGGGSLTGNEFEEGINYNIPTSLQLQNRCKIQQYHVGFTGTC